MFDSDVAPFGEGTVTLVRQLAAAFRETPLDNEAVASYADGLVSVDPGVLERVVAEAIARCASLPSLADLHADCEEMELVVLSEILGATAVGDDAEAGALRSAHGALFTEGKSPTAEDRWRSANEEFDAAVGRAQRCGAPLPALQVACAKENREDVGRARAERDAKALRVAQEMAAGELAWATAGINKQVAEHLSKHVQTRIAGRRTFPVRPVRDVSERAPVRRRECGRAPRAPARKRQSAPRGDPSRGSDDDSDEVAPPRGGAA